MSSSNLIRMAELEDFAPANPKVLEKLLGLTEAGVAAETIENYHQALKRGVPMEACGSCFGLEPVCGSCGGIGEVPAMAWDPEHLNDVEEDF